MKAFLDTTEDWTLLVQRCVLGFVMFPHGAQKLLGWFNGFGFTATMGFLTDKMSLPTPVAFLVIIAESFGAIALALGLATRLAAFGISAVMLGAILTSHLGNGFFMNWFGNQPGEGFEYHLLALALSVPLVIQGGGLWALDKVLLSKWAQRPSPMGVHA